MYAQTDVHMCTNINVHVCTNINMHMYKKHKYAYVHILHVNNVCVQKQKYACIHKQKCAYVHITNMHNCEKNSIKKMS